MTTPTKTAEVKKFEAQLEILDGKMDEMRAKAIQANSQAKAKYYEQLEEFNLQRQDAAQKFEILKSSGEDAWEEIQHGLEESLDSLKVSFEKAYAHFQ